ncbi:MAG: cell division protein ZapA [Chitinophagaceae bacterium]|jgi:cell division protein ZapA (FtsZ GTPase activity inhibitor)|nr:MAG: cell division protein ZapA [Chitinophagaceae bacterium]
MDNLIPVNIVIADRSYRIRIEPGDEEVVRKTIKLINDKIIEFKTQFAGKDMQDYISMVVLWYATDVKQRGAEQTALREIGANFDAMETLLDRALDK